MKIASSLALPIVLAACGGAVSLPTTVSDAGSDGAADGSSDAASDGAVDAPYLACMDAQGNVDPSLKHCGSDADCTWAAEQTDCCGTLLYVGIARASAAAFATCEAAWVAHFPGCGCDSNLVKTEDGKVDADGAAPAVHCVDFTQNGGICRTSMP